MSDTDAPTARAPSGIARKESTAAYKPIGCADGRRSRGRSAYRRAPRAICATSRSGTKRARQTGRRRAWTRESDWRGRDRGSREGREKVVGVVTDAETGEVLGLDVLVERDADGFMERLGDFARDCGVEAMAADDLSAYKPVVERLGIDHQICIAHARKRAWNRLDWIDGWDWVTGENMAAADGASTRRRLGASAFGADGSGRRRDSSPHARGAEREVAGAVMPPPERDVPWTNSVTELAIGRSEIRRKTVRGYKSEDEILNGFGLRRWAWSGRDGLDMSDLVAAQRRAAGWGSCAFQNPPENGQPFLGQLPSH